jgi:hypothetical protein
MFSSLDLQQANHEWGCNCGPASLAACWKLPLNHVRRFLGDFEKRRYMNGLDMQAALARLRLRVKTELADGGTEQDLWPSHGLCLVQFSGPWVTSEKASTKWALTQTHWLATKWDEIAGERWVFDVNAMGWLKLSRWSTEILPLLLAADKYRDGAWWLRHSWEIRADGGNRSRREM